MFTSTVAEPYWHVWSGDPAIDTEATVTEHVAGCDKVECNIRECITRPKFDHDQWMMTGDEECLPIKDGHAPMKFQLRHLRGRELAHLRSQFVRAVSDESYTVVDIAFTAAELGLVDVSNVRLDNKEMVVDRYTDKSGMTRVDGDIMDALYAKPDLVMELGNRVIHEDVQVNPTSSKE